MTCVDVEVEDVEYDDDGFFVSGPLNEKSKLEYYMKSYNVLSHYIMLHVPKIFRKLDKIILFCLFSRVSKKFRYNSYNKQNSIILYNIVQYDTTRA